MVRTLDGDRCVDEADQGGRHTDEVRGAAVGGARVACDVGAQPAKARQSERQARAAYAPSANHEDRLLANEAELVHGVDDGQHGGHRLVLLAPSHDESRQGNVVMLEVGLPLLAVVAANGSVANKQDSLPWLEDGCKLVMGHIEDVIHELEAYNHRQRRLVKSASTDSP